MPSKEEDADVAELKAQEDGEVAALKKERSVTKGAITRVITTIEKIEKTTENLPEIRKRMEQIPELVKRFEDVHSRLVHHLLDEEDRGEADTYREKLITETEEYQQAVYMWMAGEEGEEIPTASTTQEAETQHQRAIKELEKVKEAIRLEEETHQIEVEAQRAEETLKTLRLTNKLSRLEEKKACEEERRNLQARLEQLQLETEGEGTGPLNVSPKNIPGRTESLGSTEAALSLKNTPRSNGSQRATETTDADEDAVNRDSTPKPQYKKSRVSWEPSIIAPHEESVIKTMITEIMNETRSQQQTIVDTLQLPKRELQMFNGNPLKYWAFIQSFLTTVGRKNVDDAEKLSCLLQYCTGPARKTLECTEIMPPEYGYRRALELLEERYGDSFQISQQWIMKIIDRQDIKGPTQLRDYADDLQCCQEMLKNMGHLGDLDNAHSMRTIWKKLPQYLQDRWSHRNYEIKKRQKRNKVDLRYLVEFIAEAAEEATDPVFSRTMKETSTKGSTKQVAGSFSTTASSSSASSSSTSSSSATSKQNTPGKCPCCNDKHYITQCPQFKAMKIVERKALVMRKGLCMNCFARGHLSRDCPRDFTCNIDGCGQKHSKFLHLKPRPQMNAASTIPPAILDQQTPVQTFQPQPLQSTSTPSSHFVRSPQGKLAMPIVPARVRNPDNGTYVDTYALLDPGSNGTYCTAELQRQLDVQGTNHSIELTTITAAKMPMNTTVVSLDISSLHANDDMHYTVNAMVRPDLHINASGRSSRLELEKWPHLCDLPIPELEVNLVQLLIGQDASDLLVPEEIRRGKSGEPFATRTPLGWAVNGPVNHHSLHDNTSHFVQSGAPIEDLNRLWDIEGIHEEESGLSIKDQETIQLWNRKLQIVDGHYCLPIPYKNEEPRLKNNRAMAEKRLSSLGKRLGKDPAMKDRYTEEIHKLIEKKYAEPVPDDELRRNDGKVWYLPHHPVLNPKKPDKCRIVFDCAAQYCDSSLNDNINQGPDLANKLVGVLLRFRQGLIAFTADIEAMYHQVLVATEDRDTLRFLWFEDDEISGDVKTYRMNAHLFGGVWSPSCANFALQKVTEELAYAYPEEVLNSVRRNFYVDDCLCSTDTVESAATLALQIRELLSRRGFNLTKYVSPSIEVMKHIPEENWGKSLKALDLNLKLPTERALGMLWDIENDCLGYDAQMKEKPMTKRGILSTLSTIYDPLGYLSPFILQARRLFQQLCRIEKEWDEPLSPEVTEAWGRWLEDLPLLAGFSIPRCIKPSATPIKEAQLHHFSDASEYAYGAASYLRITLEDDSVHTKLIMAKSRLAPLKGATIPRLELAGALEAVRLDKILIKELDIPLKASVFWVDSQIVLWYINSSERRFQTYVANRVSKITEHTTHEQWRYVPTEDNPGDDASRGFTANDLITSHRWMHGPNFLHEHESKWPTQPVFMCAELESQLELKGTSTAYAVKQEADYTNYLLNYFSSWFKLRRAVVWYRRFQQYLQRKKPQSGPVKVKEMKEAETAILLYTQKALQDDSHQRKLNPATGNNGLIRVGGRLVNSQFIQDTIHPVILPYNHHISKLIIMHHHHLTGHAGVERVLAETRKNYWILKGRKLVKRVVYGCLRCKRSHGKTGVQQMANLPESRVTPYEPPFSRVGVDYFGPFLIKRGRSEVKRYGCVFTCFATRAVHIEVSYTLDTDSFLHALDRFIARRGEPKEIWSDNGTNFIGAQQELKRTVREWNQDKISTHLLKKDIDWHFNPPAASHMGGVWERLIRTIRRILTSVISQQIMDDEALMTLLTVVEGIVNNRPITRLSDDPSDSTPLTPNHLLMLRQGPSLPPGKFVETDRYKRRWKKVQYLADIFWKRWITEYIPRLQERQKWLQPQRNLQVGDLVLVNQGTAPRNQWPLGIVTKANIGADDLVRSVEIRTASGTYERPITKLCLLEGIE